MVDERARDGDALLLAAGELVGVGARTFSEVVRFGSSLKSWKTQPRLRRSWGTFEPLRRPRSRPATKMRPEVGSSSFSNRRMTVDLPDPEAPTTKTNSPFSMTNDTSERAATFGS